MKKIPFLFFLTALFFTPQLAHAELSGKIHLKLDMDFLLWEPNVSSFKNYTNSQNTTFAGLPVRPMPEHQEIITPYLTTEEKEGIDPVAIETYLRQNISGEILRERSDVTISKDDRGNITFEGIGLSGRILDEKKAAQMIAHAIENDIAYVNLPVIRDEPIVTVNNEELKEMGIKEVIGVGYSNYGNSPANRIHNIEVGLDAFNGHIIKPNEEVSFLNVLGPINGATGYLQELVILGDRTVPDYGGGLCQISSTAYRAALASGLPITERRNHSFQVSYYEPLGLDGTIFEPAPDVKFVNETPGHILVQSRTLGNDVYYVFYGTKNQRKASLLGPFLHSYGGVGPTRHEFTTELPPGVQKVLQRPAVAASISWYQYVEYPEHEAKEKGAFGFLEEIYSKYQARGLFTQTGIAAGGEGEGDAPTEVGGE